ncbi:hypothetical protein PRIPAC_93444 [Pristionchus pacificus]|nr:hypothetical protein PRIPAC_93444 [Pristionchus pacificus]
MEIAVLTMIITSNTTSKICLNGNIAEKPCILATPPNDYICASDPRNSKCENFQGTYYCCSTVPQRRAPCTDKSNFCGFLTGFCQSPEHRRMVQSDCAATCGFCNNGSAIGGPVTNPTNLTILLPAGYGNVTGNDRAAANETTFPIYQGNQNETRSVLNESMPSYDESSNKYAKGTVLVRGQRPKEMEKTNDELFGNSLFPEISTAEPEELPVSLVKTVIKGTCFDEYMYCREFVALCTHPTFSYTMAKRCALTCDRCEDVKMEEELITSKNCTDIFNNCDEHKHLCNAERYKYLLEEKCSKTCGYCKPACRDRHPNCRQFKRDGFCVDTLYTEDERQYLCGESCQLCQ